MINYNEKSSEGLFKAICKATGIPEKKLEATYKEKGVQFIVDYPAAIPGLTKSQIVKLEALKLFVNSYNEAEFLEETAVIDSSSKRRNFFKSRLFGKKDKEYFEVAFLNTRNEIIDVQTMWTGSVNESAVYPREIIKQALYLSANAVILSHNHPAGSDTPSSADIGITQKIKTALDAVSIKLLDHIIVGNDTYSFAEKGMM